MWFMCVDFVEVKHYEGHGWLIGLLLMLLSLSLVLMLTKEKVIAKTKRTV